MFLPETSITRRKQQLKLQVSHVNVKIQKQFSNSLIINPTGKKKILTQPKLHQEKQIKYKLANQSNTNVMGPISDRQSLIFSYLLGDGKKNLPTLQKVSRDKILAVFLETKDLIKLCSMAN